MEYFISLCETKCNKIKNFKNVCQFYEILDKYNLKFDWVNSCSVVIFYKDN